LLIGALGFHFYNKGMKLWEPMFNAGISSIPHHATTHMKKDDAKAVKVAKDAENEGEEEGEEGDF
jgi:hypothetical protein